MKVTLSVLILFYTEISLCEVAYLRPRNDRGPGMCTSCLNHPKIFLTTLHHLQGATRSGVECLKTVEEIYFHSELSQQVQKLAIFRSNNLSSPSAEITTNYLSDLHTRFFDNNDSEEKFQLRVIANESNKLEDSRKSRDAVLTDLYVIVGDSLKNVNYKYFSRLLNTLS